MTNGAALKRGQCFSCHEFHELCLGQQEFTHPLLRPHPLPLLPMLGEGEKAPNLWKFSLPSPIFGRGKGRGWVRANMAMFDILLTKTEFHELVRKIRENSCNIVPVGYSWLNLFGAEDSTFYCGATPSAITIFLAICRAPGQNGPNPHESEAPTCASFGRDASPPCGR